MDEQLAAIYGTGQSDVTEDDMEKAAAAELLVKLAEEEGVDLNDFSDEEVAEMIQELYQGEEKTASQEEYTDESQEKLAEADFLGRVMAHAYVQEMGEIEKQAADEAKKVPLRERAKDIAKRVGKWTGASEFGGGLKELGEARKGLKEERILRSKAMREAEGPVQQSAREGIMQFKKHLAKRDIARGAKRLGVRVGLPALGVAALGAGVHHAMKKKESAADLDKLAEDRAMQMLYSQGWVDEQGNLLHEPQVKEAEAQMSPEEAVEIRALQILEENGFPVTWNE